MGYSGGHDAVVLLARLFDCELSAHHPSSFGGSRDDAEHPGVVDARDQGSSPIESPIPSTTPSPSFLQNFTELHLDRQVTFFVGENGSGKSTLLEAIALAAGFGAEGGSRNYTPKTTETAGAVQPLADALRLSWSQKLPGGFFFRAESFFNVATSVDEYGYHAYGGRSLHAQSHGESFMALVESRLDRGGLFLMDEPEAAVSPQRQLALLVRLHDLVADHPDAQLIIATHSPILLSLPGAEIISFDGDSLETITWDQAPAVEVYRSFLSRTDWWLERLLAPELSDD